MSETKHTPGPWTAEEQRSREGQSLGWIINHRNGRIGWSSYATAIPNEGERPQGGDNPYPIGAANAKLMAAAPDLLASLKALVADIGSDLTDICPPDCIVCAARRAIAKAEGQ